VSVHRLVQAVTADQMPGDLAQAWRQAAAALIEAALPGDPQQPTSWPVFAALLPHAQAALDPASGGMEDIVSYLGYSGAYVAARGFSQTMLDERAQVLGPEHPATLTAHADLAAWTGQAGDPAAARDQYAALIPLCERVLGPEHPATLTARAEKNRWARSCRHTRDSPAPVSMPHRAPPGLGQEARGQGAERAERRHGETRLECGQQRHQRRR